MCNSATEEFEMGSLSRHIKNYPMLTAVFWWEVGDKSLGEAAEVWSLLVMTTQVLQEQGEDSVIWEEERGLGVKLISWSRG